MKTLPLGLLSVLFLSCISTRSFARDVTIDLPVLDAPFNSLNQTYTFPSMRQSEALSAAFYETAHRALVGPKESEERWKIFLVAGFDLVAAYFPGGASWLHEEWHRSVMSRRGIKSYNDVNNIPIGASLIAVSHVKDADLVRLKRDHPVEQVRLSAAGMESQVSQNLFIQRHQFFDGAADNNRFLFFMNNFGVSSYLATCASSESNKSTDEQNADDGASFLKRDFTGLDCNAWAYDLFRPDEPYTARGVHPSGTGIDRYIKWSDLNSRERDFLSLQVKLSLLNFVDPFLYKRGEFSRNIFGKPVIWNAKLTHYLTAFGYSVDAHLLLKTESEKFHFKIHNGFNYKGFFPGVSAEWIDRPLTDKLELTGGVTLWPQPRGQRFDAKTSETLAAAKIELARAIDLRTKIYVGLSAKTPGWMAGEVFLDRSVSVWSGARIGLF